MEKVVNVRKIMPTKEEVEATREYKRLMKKIKSMIKTETIS